MTTCRTASKQESLNNDLTDSKVAHGGSACDTQFLPLHWGVTVECKHGLWAHTDHVLLAEDGTQSVWPLVPDLNHAALQNAIIGVDVDTLHVVRVSQIHLQVDGGTTKGVGNSTGGDHAVNGITGCI